MKAKIYYSKSFNHVCLLFFVFCFFLEHAARNIFRTYTVCYYAFDIMLPKVNTIKIFHHIIQTQPHAFTSSDPIIMAMHCCAPELPLFVHKLNVKCLTN